MSSKTKPIDILLATIDRHQPLAMTLSGLALQTLSDLRLVIADQSEQPVWDDPTIRNLLRLIEVRGGQVEYHHRTERRGIAEQRHFLLGKASAPYVLYLDDDVFMEPWVLSKLHEVIKEQGCAFVGAFGAGLSFLDDSRPDQQAIEYWEGRVQPEAVEPDSPEWERWHLHRAANLFHVAQKLPPGESRLYKIAWISTCILYNRQMLESVGGFSFWEKLPRFHSGEEVLVQNLLMRLWGGCGIIPAGTYFAQAPTTTLNPEGRVDGHALDLLPEMLDRYVHV